MSKSMKEPKSTDISVEKLIELTKSNKELIEDDNIRDFIEYLEKKEKMKKENIKYSFKPDEMMKYAFNKIEKPKLIALINKLCGTNFKLDSKVTIISTEHIKVTGDISKSKVIGDFAVKIESPENDEISKTVVIEFQSSEDADMPLRIYVYGFNVAEMVKTDIKTVEDGTEKLKKANVRIEPYEVIIYTTLEVKDKQGFKEFHNSSANFKVNGVPHSINNGDVVTQIIPFYNLLRMELKDFETEEFDFLQPIYLYKYKKYPELIKSKDTNFIEDIEIINNNISNLNGYAKVIATESFVNITRDFNSFFNLNKNTYQKEIESMDYISGTYAGQLRKEGIDIGIDIGEEKKIQEIMYNMLSDFTDLQISKVTGKSIAEIEVFRAENS